MCVDLKDKGKHHCLCGQRFLEGIMIINRYNHKKLYVGKNCAKVIRFKDAAKKVSNNNNNQPSESQNRNPAPLLQSEETKESRTPAFLQSHVNVIKSLISHFERAGKGQIDLIPNHKDLMEIYANNPKYLAYAYYLSYCRINYEMYRPLNMEPFLDVFTHIKAGKTYRIAKRV
jgi:hypothetical protein